MTFWFGRKPWISRSSAIGIKSIFPRTEDYGLTRQIRRAAVSIAANVAEGNGRGHFRECAHHVSIARGSTREVETHFIIATRIGLMTGDDLPPILRRLDEVSRMLDALRRSLLRRVE